MTNKNKTKVEDIVAQGAFNVLKNDMLLHVKKEQNSAEVDLAKAFGVPQGTKDYLENAENMAIIKQALLKENRKTKIIEILLAHSSSLEEFVFIVLLVMEIKKALAIGDIQLPFEDLLK